MLAAAVPAVHQHFCCCSAHAINECLFPPPVVLWRLVCGAAAVEGHHRRHPAQHLRPLQLHQRRHARQLLLHALLPLPRRRHTARPHCRHREVAEVHHSRRPLRTRTVRRHGGRRVGCFRRLLAHAAGPRPASGEALRRRCSQHVAALYRPDAGGAADQRGQRDAGAGRLRCVCAVLQQLERHGPRPGRRRLLARRTLHRRTARIRQGDATDGRGAGAADGASGGAAGHERADGVEAAEGRGRDSNGLRVRGPLRVDELGGRVAAGVEAVAALGEAGSVHDQTRAQRDGVLSLQSANTHIDSSPTSRAASSPTTLSLTALFCCVCCL